MHTNCQYLQLRADLGEPKEAMVGLLTPSEISALTDRFTVDEEQTPGPRLIFQAADWTR
jgi:hypothetical protein